MPERPILPDLDPRTDAHIIGNLALPGFLLLLVGATIIVLVGMLIGPLIIGIVWSLGISILVAIAWSIWIIADGPAQMIRTYRWKQRHQVHAALPGLPMPFSAGQEADPLWTSHGITWAMALLTLPPTTLLESDALTTWHQRLAQALRVAMAHGILIDIRSTQLPGSDIIPTETVENPTIQARWQWWIQMLGPRSVISLVTVRMGWASTQRDPAWIHFQSVEQAWAAMPGPGQWQWLSALSARDLVNASANPPDTYGHWVHSVLNQITSESSLEVIESTTSMSKGGIRRKARIL